MVSQRLANIVSIDCQDIKQGKNAMQAAMCTAIEVKTGANLNLFCSVGNGGRRLWVIGVLQELAEEIDFIS